MEAFAAREFAEVFWILALDAQHRIILSAPIAITRGTLTSSLVHPREVFRAAIVAGAAAVILCHNHPSGDTTPSADDRLVTQQLVEAGKLLDIPVHDHIIVSDGPRYTSFAEADCSNSAKGLAVRDRPPASPLSILNPWRFDP
jgi:DNA repair protein RadC